MEKRKVKNDNVYIIEAHLKKFDKRICLNFILEILMANLCIPFSIQCIILRMVW